MPTLFEENPELAMALLQAAGSIASNAHTQNPLQAIGGGLSTGATAYTQGLAESRRNKLQERRLDQQDEIERGRNARFEIEQANRSHEAGLKREAATDNIHLRGVLNSNQSDKDAAEREDLARLTADLQRQLEGFKSGQPPTALQEAQAYNARAMGDLNQIKADSIAIEQERFRKAAADALKDDEDEGKDNAGDKVSGGIEGFSDFINSPAAKTASTLNKPINSHMIDALPDDIKTKLRELFSRYYGE